MKKRSLFQRIKNRIVEQIISLIHFRFLFKLCRLYLFKYVQKEMRDEWLDKKKLPFFFKKEIDLYSWYFKAPEMGSKWLDQAVLARMILFKNCKVLDLCSGDGFFPYMFYCDFAQKIDALDFDKDAIEHSKKNYSHEKISHYQKNIITDEFPDKNYDVVFWNTAMDYFSREQQLIIFDKIIAASKKEIKFVGSVPKVLLGTKHSNNHYQHFTDKKDLEDVFLQKFNNFEIFDITYHNEGIFYFKCWNPK